MKDQNQAFNTTKNMALTLSLKEIKCLGSGDRVAAATGELHLVNHR